MASRSGAERPSGLIVGAAAYAAAEMLVAVWPGGFLAWGRAEALLFLAFRPFLLLLAAAAAGRLPWRRRWLFYALALVLAGAGETALLVMLGAASPWTELVRGTVGGVAMALVADGAVQGGRRLFGPAPGTAAALLLAGILLSIPGTSRPYETVVLGPARRAPVGPKPELALMTALPVVWGEGGAFDPRSRPAAAYTALQEEFAVRPIDVLDPQSLGGAKLLLLAQPRWLAPEELSTLDAWVQGGGRVLVLTDPNLVWPSELPLGDVRRPPPVGLLGPLLAHWGLKLEPWRSGRGPERLGDRRLAMESPGRFVSAGRGCRVERPYLARCRPGSGRAVLIADADLMRDALWVAPGRHGAERHLRIADNPLILADILDGLAGLQRKRVEGRVAWRAEDAHPALASAAVLGLLVALALAGLLLSRRRRG
ncbi:MAG TPA: Gldg family protein [Allosphingosinicella sp.]